MSSPIVLLLLFVIGVVIKYSGKAPANIHKNINKFILYVPLPAIVLTKIPFLEITHEVLYPIAAAWIIFAGSALYAYLVCRIFRYDKKTMACLILCCGLGNTSFVGYPFMNYFYGAESIRYAIFVDQPGSFLIMSTFGVIIATYFSAKDFTVKDIILRLIKFPPFIVFLVALFIPSKIINGHLLDALKFIGDWMVPLAILSLGLQFKLSFKEIEWKKLWSGIFYKLLLAPGIIFILYYCILKKQGEMYAVTVLECAMPPMITSSIIATEYELDEPLANALPTLGILFSVPTLLFWKWLV